MTEETPNKRDVSDLSAEVNALRAELAEREGTGRRTGWWRAVLCTLLLVVVVVLAPVTVLARWTHGQIAKTDTYVDTVAPLASDPDVQNAIAARITTVLFQYIDVGEITDEAATALEDRGLSAQAAAGLRALNGPLEQAVQSFVEERVLATVQSEAFAQAWENANREAHGQMVAALTGETSGSVTVSGEDVRVSLSAFIDTVKSALVDQGFALAERIPEVDATFVVFSSSDLGKAQKGFHLLDLAATVLPVIALVLIGAAILVSRNRRSTTIAAALCVAAGMILLGLILALLRPLYLDALPASSSQAAAAAVYDTLIWPMRRNLRIVLALALLVAVVTWLSGPSTSARRIRSGTVGAVTWVRERARDRHVDTGEFGHTLWDLRTPIQIGIVVLGLLTLLWSLPVSAPRLTWTLVLMVLAWIVLEALATPPRDTSAFADVTSEGTDEPGDKAVAAP